MCIDHIAFASVLRHIRFLEMLLKILRILMIPSTTNPDALLKLPHICVRALQAFPSNKYLRSVSSYQLSVVAARSLSLVICLLFRCFTLLFRVGFILLLSHYGRLLLLGPRELGARLVVFLFSASLILQVLLAGFVSLVASRHVC